jgi:predicted polyphosphate/ATP-dependent NAD kinase
VRIGLVVNPVAGLGGAVGLKGTDGPDTVAEALRRGARPEAGPRARRALERLAQRRPGAAIVVAPGLLGEDWAAGLALSPEVAGPRDVTGTARDSREAVAAMGGCDLVAFAGGDGTARDVAAALGPGQGMLGIPCGVKMHSGVFAVTPEAAGALLADLLTGPDPPAWEEAEVMDIDEAALRAGRLSPRLYGLARVPVARSRVQAAKGGPREDAAAALRGAAREVVAGMDASTLYVIGPGSSAGAVMRAAGHEPTLLGADAMRAGRVVARDARAAELERLAGDGPVRIVLGVTGRQGFLLGRGNQQIGRPLIARAGREGLVVLATEAKLAALAQPRLWVDTGDPALDAGLAGFVRVRTGAGRETVMRLAAGDGPS